MNVQQPGRVVRARHVVVLLALLVVTACASAVTSVPPPSATARPIPPSIAVTTPTEMASPTAALAPEPTLAPTIQPTVPSPATATATAALSPSAIAGIAAGDAAPGCGPSHLAVRGESSDLSVGGRGLAPTLESFNQYRMDLALDPEQAVLTGTQTLDFTNRTAEPLSDLLFHLYPNLPDFQGRLDITCAAVDGVAVAPRLEDGNWKLWITLPAPLAPDASAEVTLHFTTATPHDVGESAYGAFNAEEDIWTLASFYPTLAIRVDGGWDQARPSGWSDYVNSDMALYNVRIALPESYQLLASGVVTSTCTADGCAAVAAAGPQRDFTLAISEGWEQAQRTVGETRVVSSFPPEWRAGGERALDLAADAVERYNENFGVYPYVELDILPVTAVGFAGVEYPGLIMIGDSFYDDDSAGNGGMLDVVVHEVAHMWWYNVVGNDVLREPWLDEGLTSYTAEYLYIEWSGQGEQPLTGARRAQLQRLGLESTPIDLEVAQYADPQSYVAVVYGRAPLFFDALRRELGDDIFFDVLREHYHRNAFGRATTVGFEALVEEIAGRELDPFLSGWLARKQP